ncbi:hypothetical protein HK101_009378, partial [Irineochytrium annulatum]
MKGSSEDVGAPTPTMSTDDLKPEVAALPIVDGGKDLEAGKPGALSNRPLGDRMREVVVNYLPLAFITFGGPQAHIALLLNLFVVKRKWLTERMFAEIFSISNALPGPASTQMAFTLALIRGGVVPGICAFLLWSVPGGIVMASVGYGVSRLGQGGIPVWVQHIENGLDSVAVALVAGAAMKLTDKILTTTLTRTLAVISLAFVVNFADKIWMIPLLMVFGGIVSSVEAAWPSWKASWVEKRTGKKADGHDVVAGSGIELNDGIRRRNVGATEANAPAATSSPTVPPAISPSKPLGPANDDTDDDDIQIEFSYSAKAGIVLIVVALSLLVVAIVLRSVQGIPTPFAIIGTFYFV